MSRSLSPLIINDIAYITYAYNCCLIDRNDGFVRVVNLKTGKFIELEVEAPYAVHISEDGRMIQNKKVLYYVWNTWKHTYMKNTKYILYRMYFDLYDLIWMVRNDTN